MFCVLFEVHPRSERFDAYLGLAGHLRPQLEGMEGFVDNVRYRSLARDGWILSLSTWRDEKALVRWRVHAQHHEAQERGRGEIFLDYHLRVGEVTLDTRMPAGHASRDQRLDATVAGEGTAVVLVDVSRDPDLPAAKDPSAFAASLGLAGGTAGLLASEAFEAILTPGDFIVIATFRDEEAAQSFARTSAVPARARVRCVRVVRDYGMFDRREAPQYYPTVTRTA